MKTREHRFYPSRRSSRPRSPGICNSEKSRVAGHPVYRRRQRSYVPCSLLTVSGWPDGRAPNKHTSCSHTDACTHTGTCAPRTHTHIYTHTHTRAHARANSIESVRTTHAADLMDGRREAGQLKWSSLVHVRRVSIHLQ